MKTNPRLNQSDLLAPLTEKARKDLRAAIEQLNTAGFLWDASDLSSGNHHGQIQQIFQFVDNTEGISAPNFHGSNRAFRAAFNILKCRTPAAGLNTDDICEHCRATIFHYNSCHDSSCPVCQNMDRELWVLQQSQYLLDVPYAHLIFTIPHELNPLAKHIGREFYDLFFKAVSETITDFASDPKWIGGTPGFMAHLHTGGSLLTVHPHLHVLLCSACLDQNLKLVHSKRKIENGSDFLFPARAVAAMFRGKLCYYLTGYLQTCFLKEPQILPGMEEYEVFEKKEWFEYLLAHRKEFMDIVENSKTKRWNVEIRKAVLKGENVIQYLGKYINRLPIAESSIIRFNENEVVFLAKDYKKEGEKITVSVTPHEFVQRLMDLVPPKGLCRTRFYGFWGNHNRDSRFKMIREANFMEQPADLIDVDLYELINLVHERGREYFKKHPEHSGFHQNSGCSHRHQADKPEDSSVQKSSEYKAGSSEVLLLEQINIPDNGCELFEPAEKEQKLLKADFSQSNDQKSDYKFILPTSRCSSFAAAGEKSESSAYRDASLCPVCGKKRRNRPFNKMWPTAVKLWAIRDVSKIMCKPNKRIPLRLRN